MFNGRSILALATALLATGGQCQPTSNPASKPSSYEEHISTLAHGNLIPEKASKGIVWLNITEFATDKLPHVQNNIGIESLDNAGLLKDIAGLAQTAATNGQYGDFVFLHSAFEMNGYYANVSSEQMQEALAEAVTDPSGKIDESLVGLYARTSSSKELADAFQTLKGDQPNNQWDNEMCSSSNQAGTIECLSLINNVKSDSNWKSGSPRSICQYGCCISWSQPATFQVKNLYNAAHYCATECGTSGKVSCKVWGVRLQSFLVNQCLSNRGTGCV